MRRPSLFLPGIRACLAACLLVAMLGGSVRSAFPADWKAGVAKVSITPDRPMWMAGYASRDHAAEGKLTELWAKALVIEDPGGHRGVLVTLDLIGIDRELSLALCGAIEDRLDVARDQIILATSHTHTGPVVRRNLRPMHYSLLDPLHQQLIDRYATILEQKIPQLAEDALDGLRPCTLKWGRGDAGFAVNRRNNVERDVPQLRAARQLKGPVDHRVPVLSVYHDNRLAAVVFGYACHATVLSFYEWSGDYPGFAQIDLEQAHPGAIAMFWAGCGADQNPLPRRTVELARKYGSRLAQAVDRVLAGPMREVTGSLDTRYHEIPLPLGAIPDRPRIEKDAESQNRYVAARAKMYLRQLDQGRPLETTYPYPIGVWSIGEVDWVTLGGEVVVDYSLRLARERESRETWIAGYAHDVMAYIPSQRVLDEGGYEGGGAMVYYGLPSPWASGVEERIVREVHRQLGERRK